MAHWPKTVRGNVVAVVLIVAVAPTVLIAAVALSGPLIWAALIAIAITSVAVYVWRRRLESARERAWVGQFSFGSVVASMHARAALDLPVR
jgi:Flp pilus assembly protein TadB